MLQLDHVTVRYGTTTAVDDMSASLARGEWVALIGPNGAGKSTLLRAVARLEDHDGEVAIDECSTRHLSHRALARAAAYVPQSPELPGGMTVIDYAMLGRTPHIGRFGVESMADRYACLALLERIGIDHLAERMLPTLSGGEVQRAVLARALAQQAPVLLLDEPTSALDIGNRVDALELVDDLRTEFGLTVVSVLHDLTLAGQFADRLILLDGGRHVKTGPPAEVLNAALLSRCFGGHVHVFTDDAGFPVVVPTRIKNSAITDTSENDSSERGHHAHRANSPAGTPDTTEADPSRLAGAD